MTPTIEVTIVELKQSTFGGDGPHFRIRPRLRAQCNLGPCQNHTPAIQQSPVHPGFVAIDIPDFSPDFGFSDNDHRESALFILPSDRMSFTRPATSVGNTVFERNVARHLEAGWRVLRADPYQVFLKSGIRPGHVFDDARCRRFPLRHLRFRPCLRPCARTSQKGSYRSSFHYIQTQEKFRTIWPKFTQIIGRI